MALRSAVWLGKGAAPSLEQTKTEAEGKTEVAAEAGAPAPVSEPTPSLAAEPAAAAETAEPLRTPIPASDELRAEANGEDITFILADRRWRVRGLGKNTSYEALRVNLLCSQGAPLCMSTPLTSTRPMRAAFIKQAAIELRIKEDVHQGRPGRSAVEARRAAGGADQTGARDRRTAAADDEEERDEALALLKIRQSLRRILDDFHAAVWWARRPTSWWATWRLISRKLDKPLAVIIQSTSAAGKSLA